MVEVVDRRTGKVTFINPSRRKPTRIKAAPVSVKNVDHGGNSSSTYNKKHGSENTKCRRASGLKSWKLYRGTQHRV